MDGHHAARVCGGDVVDSVKRAGSASGERDQTSPEAVREALRDAQASLEQAVVQGNLSKDPMRFPLGALAVTLGAMHKMFTAHVAQSKAISHEMERRAAEIVPLPIEPASLSRLEKAAARGAERAAGDLARVHYLRTVLAGSLAVMTIAAAGVGGGYWWGRSDAMTRFRIADAGFAAMVHDNPTAATGWLNLAQLNDYAKVMSACQGSAGFTDASGRHACAVPLWLEDQPPSAPPKAAASGGKAPPA